MEPVTASLDLLHIEHVLDPDATPDDSFRERMMPIHRDDFTANINGTGDLVIKLKYCKWTVDSEKFKNASAFFEMALKGNRWREAHGKCIDLHDDCPLMFARFIQFVYNGSYSTCSKVLREWYGDETLTSETTDLKFLATGIPVYLSDILHDENAAKEAVVIFENYIRFALERRKRWRDQDHMPMTKRESDIAADIAMNSGEIHVLMYQLADKYGVPDLQRYALTQLRKDLRYRTIRRVGTRLVQLVDSDILKVFATMKQVVPDYTTADTELKQALACGIADKYRAIRIAESEAATKIKGWLSSDDELCFMVMDILAPSDLDKFASLA